MSENPKSVKDISKCKIIRRAIYRERLHVALEPKFIGKRYMPYAHYIWLVENPAFAKIPKGYSIHHLDGDRLNDDITNLAMMRTNHHLAYHKKNWPSKTEPIELIGKEQEAYYPGKIPAIGYDEGSNTYYLSIYESAKNGGDNTSKKIWRYNGEKLRTKKLAEKARDAIWEDSLLRRKLGSDLVI